MTKDIENIITHHKELKHFFDYPNKRDSIIDSVTPSTIHALQSLIKFTKNTLKKHFPLKELGTIPVATVTAVSPAPLRRQMFIDFKLDEKSLSERFFCERPF